VEQLQELWTESQISRGDKMIKKLNIIRGKDNFPTPSGDIQKLADKLNELIDAFNAHENKKVHDKMEGLPIKMTNEYGDQIDYYLKGKIEETQEEVPEMVMKDGYIREDAKIVSPEEVAKKIIGNNLYAGLAWAIKRDIERVLSNYEIRRLK